MQARKKLLILGASALSTVGLTALALAAPASAAPSPGVCTNGSILGGTYASLTINGDCTVDRGIVNVTGTVTVKPGATLFADYGGSDLRVKGNVSIGLDALVTLGCGPTNLPCFNDPNPAHPTMSTHHSFGDKITANGAGQLLINNSSVKGAVAFSGGSSLCAVKPVIGGAGSDAGLRLDDISACAVAFEDSNFGGAVTIKNAVADWAGLIRNQVVGTVTYNTNATNSPFGNEIVGNKIGGDLRCSGNTPPPQAGTASGGPNLVAGVRTGQCQSTSLP